MGQKKPTKRQHMQIKWHDIVKSDSDIPAKAAPLKEKTSLVGRVGSMMLACGTSAWRVRAAMNKISGTLGISTNIDVGLTTIHYTCIEDGKHYSQTIALPTTGVNTDKLMDMEMFIDSFDERASEISVEKIHEILDEIDSHKPTRKAWQLGLAAGVACCAFTFLLGGGPIEMICAFIGAGIGNFIRKLMLERKLSLLVNVAISVLASCLSYVLAIRLMELAFNMPATHHAGYICAMLFIIPGFPLITGGIDLAKLDLRSGIERITYAVLIIGTSTLVGWVTAMIVQFNPEDFAAMNISMPVKIALQVIMSFIGVFGFSMMFNSPVKMAVTAGFIGTITNVLRLALIEAFALPLGVSAFIGAFLAGILASIIKRNVGYPRISLTIPSIVIMVPGMFMYKAIYYFGLYDLSTGADWLTKAILIVVALPLGLVFARFCTDRDYRHCS